MKKTLKKILKKHKVQLNARATSDELGGVYFYWGQPSSNKDVIIDNYGKFVEFHSGEEYKGKPKDVFYEFLIRNHLTFRGVCLELEYGQRKFLGQFRDCGEVKRIYFDSDNEKIGNINLEKLRNTPFVRKIVEENKQAESFKGRIGEIEIFDVLAVLKNDKVYELTEYNTQNHIIFSQRF